MEHSVPGYAHIPITWSEEHIELCKSYAAGARMALPTAAGSTALLACSGASLIGLTSVVVLLVCMEMPLLLERKHQRSRALWIFLFPEHCRRCV